MFEKNAGTVSMIFKKPFQLYVQSVANIAPMTLAGCKSRLCFLSAAGLYAPLLRPRDGHYGVECLGFLFFRSYSHWISLVATGSESMAT